VIIIFMTFVGASRLPVVGQTRIHLCTTDLHSCLLAWRWWDAIVYLGIAKHGYTLIYQTVFFPLWPLLIRCVGTLFGGSNDAFYLASLLLTNIFFYLALVFFYALLERDFDASVAKNAMIYLSFNPYALFFFAGYTEALFLMLCLATFFFLQHGKWWLAGLTGFFAALTRSPGILLTIPFLVLFVQHFWQQRTELTTWRQKLGVVSRFMPIVLIPCGVVVFMSYLWYTKGNPLLFATQEADYWHRYLSFPWHGFIRTFHYLFVEPSHIDLNVLDLIFTALPLIILILGWRHLPLHYRLFAAMMALFPLLHPAASVEPLVSMPRYMMVNFSVFVICALWGKNTRFDKAYLAFCLPILAINTALFVNHNWVA
jgi:hypothetical protein